jgi:hypothetical protein
VINVFHTGEGEVVKVLQFLKIKKSVVIILFNFSRSTLAMQQRDVRQSVLPVHTFIVISGS